MVARACFLLTALSLVGTVPGPAQAPAAAQANAYAEQKVELISDLQQFDNELLNTETSLAAPLSTHVALKLGYTVRFVSQPQPTFRKTDTVLSAGVQLQF